MNQINYILYCIVIVLVATLMAHSAGRPGNSWSNGSGYYGGGSGWGSGGGWSSAGSFHK